MLSPPSDPLTWLGQWLQDAGYQFVTTTPATHARVNARQSSPVARSLRDVFGWSRPFPPTLLPVNVQGWLDEAGLLEEAGELFRSRVRFSSLSNQLYAHSAFPTTEADAVFFGPDTYRFVSLIERELAAQPLLANARILDIGCGAGPGGIAAALAASTANPELVLSDINRNALDYARVNAQLAGLNDVTFVQSDLFSVVEGHFDLIVSNPPYLVDAAARTYRHGGGGLGSGLSERIVNEGLPRLAPGGRLMLYTGAAMIDGVDPFFQAVQPVLKNLGWLFRYFELDPDVFGEELETPAYVQADRIAAIALVVQKPTLPA